jgi:hypothetical protein
MSTAKRLQGPVSRTDRENYRTRLAEDVDDATCGRPEAKTAEEVCRLVEVDPATLTAARQRGSDGERVAARAFVVALDTVLAAGERNLRLTRNLLFDALAPRWSLAYRAAQQRGAAVSYDMSEATLKQTWRELILAGVNFPAIWELLIRQTRSKKPKTPPHPQLIRLYTVSAAASSEHARGRKVWLEQEDVRLLDDVLVTIIRDAYYRRRESRRLLLADDDATAAAGYVRRGRLQRREPQSAVARRPLHPGSKQAAL